MTHQNIDALRQLSAKKVKPVMSMGIKWLIVSFSWRTWLILTIICQKMTMNIATPTTPHDMTRSR